MTGGESVTVRVQRRPRPWLRPLLALLVVAAVAAALFWLGPDGLRWR